MTSSSFAILLLSLAAPFAQAADAPEAERRAILAMQGDYAVDFAFDETVRLAPGYERAPAQRSGGNEAVMVVDDGARHIVLQHVLVDPKSGHVTKHWRQDWTYEAPRRFEFTSDQTWTTRALTPSKTQGAWTQCVYEVSDAPRYCGTGRWTFDDGVATWTSDTTWRPLPRREYTRRKDYNALMVVNRHTITKNGWTHEQFNTKVLRHADGRRIAIAREFGFNDYRPDHETDFQPAHAYWNATRDYWARVRTRWDARLAGDGLRLKTPLDGMAIIMPLFEQAQRTPSGAKIADAEIDRVFAEWVAPAR